MSPALARKPIQALISLIGLSLSSQTEEGTLIFENIDISTNQAKFEPTIVKITYRTNPSITSSSDISLSKIPTLRGRDNYIEWAREIRYPLKIANTWEFVLGERKIFDIPPYLYNILKRLTDLIQRRRQKYNQKLTDHRRNTNNNEAEYSNSVYIAISLASAKQELEYFKNDLKNWKAAKKFESEGINIVHAIILVSCKQ